MYKVEILPQERFEHAAIARRRRDEQARKARFFDAPTRVLGVDVAALEQQLGQKHTIEYITEERERAFEATADYQRQVMEFFDRKREVDRRDVAKKVDLFRKEQQKADSRREWDLNDPHFLRKESPPRTGDSDPKIGVSGLQKFEGEDLESQKRIQKQKEQIRVWTLEQLFEKAERKRAQVEDTKRYDDFVSGMTKTLQALEHESQDLRARQAKADMECNRRMAEAKQMREMEDKQRETQANIAEIQGQINGAFLCERPDVFNIGSGHQVRVDDFKGITEEQTSNVRQIQEQQREEAQKRREAENKEQEAWAIQEAAISRARLLLERENERKARESAYALRRQNQSKAQEDRERQEYINKVVYSNPAQPAYFDQFNTSSR